MIKLSIIVPVYNVEKYIRPCFESIFNQGLNDDEYEVIIVNDGTKDRSMEMIEEIISQHTNITIINQENQGLSVARNNGIKAAKGEYILMPDSDDMLIENSLKPLLEKALETKVDLIVADFVKIDANDNTLKIQQRDFNIKEKTGFELFLEDLNPHECYVWRTLYKRVFLLENKLKFTPGVYCQDVPFTHEAYIKAKKCIKTSWLLNIYRKARLESASLSFGKKKALDYTIIISKTWELTKLSNLTPEVLRKLKNDIYTSFTVFVHGTFSIIKDNKYRTFLLKELKRNTPDLFFSNGLNQWINSISFTFFPNLYFHFIKIKNILRKNFIISKKNKIAIKWR